MISLIHDDCLEAMKQIPDQSIDLVLCDLPYGTTQNKWDSMLPLDQLWQQYLRIGKQDCFFVFTAVQPFTSMLVMSQFKMFKYDWIWRKKKGTNHLNAKRQPLRDKEDIVVFSQGNPAYSPQMVAGSSYKARGGNRNDETYGEYTNQRNDNEGFRYPKQVLDFPIVERNRQHPSEKPVDLLRYFIRTYSSPGDTVLDNTMGSGSTATAAMREGRKFVGIEKDEKYFQRAQKRVDAEIISDFWNGL